jgi:hypothetical protein
MDCGRGFRLPNTAMEDSSDAALSAELGSSERLLWSGRPRRVVILNTLYGRRLRSVGLRT